MTDSPSKTALIWFRNDLRVTDNASLTSALQNHDRVVAYVSLRPSWFAATPWGFRRTERFRARFWLETLAELKANLEALNISLYVDRSAEGALPQVCAAHDVTDVYLQHEWTRDEREEETSLPDSVAVHRVYDQLLMHPDDVPLDFDEIPEVFTQFRKTCEKHVAVRPCLAVPAPLAPENRQAGFPELPSLPELGFENFAPHPRSVFPFLGGTAAARERLQSYFWDTRKLSVYKKTRNGLLGTDYSSKFSPWLANGSLSPREIYWAVKDYEREVTKNQSTYWLVFELLWRDYFKYVVLKHGDQVFARSSIQRRHYDWVQDPEVFAQWINGETSEPFVNANMIELAQTGFMSNRGRQNVASFLTKQLHIDWRWGAAYFEALLLDHDVHSNVGNWAYNSGVGNDPRDRTFNVALQAERYDAAGRYQRRWLQQDLGF